MSKLQATMDRFLVEALGCEAIDRLQLTGTQKQARKADYFHSDRHIVIEVKLVADDRERPLRRILRRWSRESDWPKFRGTLNIRDLVAIHPRGRELMDELNGTARSVIEAACRNADEQLASTVQAFHLEETMRILILLNDRVDVLDPNVMASHVTAIIRPEPGERRICPNIDTAIVFTWAHMLLQSQGQPREVAFVIPADDPPPDVPMFENHIVSCWSACRGKPLDDRGVIRTPEDLAQFSYKGRNEVITIDLDETKRQEPPA